MIKLIDDKRVDMYKDGMRLIGEVKGEKAPPRRPSSSSCAAHSHVNSRALTPATPPLASHRRTSCRA